MKKLSFIFLCFVLVSITNAQSTRYVWDSIKRSTMPVVLPAFVNQYNTPFKQPLASYGWEDGLQISPDGLNLYALYVPMDFISWQSFLVANPSLPICSTLCNMSFIRPYASTYGIDLVTNPFGCDSFPNVDIIYSHRNTVIDSFLTWQLSGIPRPGSIEGGPATLFSEADSSQLDLFCFTGIGDIWMIRNTTANPTGINNATRLPTPINPNSTEFNADNAFLARIDWDSIILIYEKYTDPGIRDFMFTLSADNGNTWSIPQTITTITNSLGHIEHPSLYKDKSRDEWWLYFSLDNAYITRAKQTIAGNWNSWDTPENIIYKGNALAIGEPTVTKNGDISFSLAYINTVTNDTTDVYDLDPWFLPHKTSTGINNSVNDHQVKLKVQPNPFSYSTTLQTDRILKDATLTVYNVFGQLVKQIKNILGQTIVFQREDLSSGLYFIRMTEENKIIAVDKLLITY
jgi:hypothetical protein